MRLLVTGSRHWDNRALLNQTLGILCNRAPLYGLILGDCPTGADRMALEWFRSRNFGFATELQVFKADWKTHGRAAGPIRNENMVLQGKPTLGVAFFQSGVANHGTFNCTAVMDAHQIPWVQVTSTDEQFPLHPPVAKAN